MFWLSHWLSIFSSQPADDLDTLELSHGQTTAVSLATPVWLHLTNLPVGHPVEMRIARSSPITPGEVDIAIWKPESNYLLSLLKPKGTLQQQLMDQERLVLHPMHPDLWLQLSFRWTGQLRPGLIHPSQVELGVRLESQIHGIPLSGLHMACLMLVALAFGLLLTAALFRPWLENIPSLRSKQQIGSTSTVGSPLRRSMLK